MPLIRIRRLAGHFITCGINIGVPEGEDIAVVSQLCPQLVPGQLVEVPDGHWTTRHHLLEVVRGPEKDEFIRPWKFSSPEAAVMANPSSSLLDADTIASGLQMTEGAQFKGRRDYEDRKLRQDAYAHGRDTHDMREDEEDYRPTSQNRMTAEERDALTADDVDDDGKAARRTARPRGRR